MGWLIETHEEESHWFLKWLTKKGRRRIINDPVNGRPYMYRYHIFKNKNEDDQQTGFNIFIHKIVQSDGRHLHDHPWNYITVILKGGYKEYTPLGVYNQSPGHVLFRRAKSLHRLELYHNEPCWTLFVRFKQKRKWGFIVNGQWIDCKTYHNAKYFLQG